MAWTSARNLPTNDPELAAKIMRATAAQNVRVSQPVYHLALSFDRGDVVDRATMERIADRVLSELKLEQHQAIIVAHADRAHPHMHILINRVHPETARVWDRWQDQPAIQRALREQEKALGLRPVEASLGVSRDKPSNVRELGVSHPHADLAVRNDQRNYSRSGAESSGIQADFEAHERVSEASRERFAAEREVTAAEARLGQVDSALRRDERAEAACRDALTKAFAKPESALQSFLEVANQYGEREAVRQMRECPETFGVLIICGEQRGILGRATRSENAARDSAREAAAFGTEMFAARREIIRLAGPMRSTDAAIDARGGVIALVARGNLANGLEDAKMRLQVIRSAERTLPSRDELEHRLAQALRRLSPPEFERLRSSLSPRRLALAHELRQTIRDVVLGREAEH